MNKNLFLIGAVAVAGFFTLTAFGGKTLEQQQAEVTAAIAAKIATLRSEKQADCDTRVAAAAQTKYDEVLAARTAEMAAQGTKGKKGKGPRVDPLPQGSKPKTDPSKDKWNPNGSSTQPSKEKWTPPSENGTPATPPASKSKWQKSGGGN